MCGFVGSINFNGLNESRETIKYILKKTLHRGPDEKEILSLENFCFGFNRLSIVGLNSQYSTQPLKIGNNILLFNGEIYNYKKLYPLVSEYIKNKKNYGDTEILFYLLKKFGLKFTLNKIEGMYTIAWIDIKKKSLKLIRDRIGEKPIYYFMNDNEFWFGSEIKCITLSGKTNKKINIGMINDYFVNGKIHGKFTFFEDIFEIQPGQILHLNIEKKKIKKENYWKIEDIYKKKKIRNFEKAKHHLKEILTNSTIGTRLNTEVPIGILLSSGVDSNAILDILNKKKLIKNLNIFTAKNSNKKIDESKYVDQILNNYKKNLTKFSKIYKVKLTNNENLKIIENLTYYYDEPIPFLMSPLIYKLCEMAKKNKIKVLLSGEGSDEIFFGYNRFIDTYKKIKDKKNKNKIIDEIYFGNGLKDKNLITELTGSNNFSKMQSYLWLKKNYDNYNGLKLMEFYRQKYIFQNLLQRNDRIGMSQSIEIRAPFLAYQLFDFANKLELNAKFQNGFTKYILRKTFFNKNNKKFMFSKKKLPFPTSLYKFLYTKSFKDTLVKLINSNKSFSKKYMNIKVINNIISNHFAKKNDFHNILWKLYALEIWNQQIHKLYPKTNLVNK